MKNPDKTTLDSLIPELLGAGAAGTMSLLHEVSTEGLPGGPRRWLSFFLKFVISAAFGTMITALLTGLGYGNLHLGGALAGLSGWIGADATISVLRKKFNLD